MNEINLSKLITGILVTVIVIIGITGLLKIDFTAEKFQKKPKEIQEKLLKNEHLITIESIRLKDSVSNYVLIDIRNQYEFEKGHLENALNIYAPEILSDANSAIFKELKERKKMAVLYGNNPQEVNAPFLILCQLGYGNIKLLAIENSYSQNKLITKNCDVEKSEANIAAFISESVNKASIIPKAVPKPQPKKVITIEKKKKAPSEGGC